MKKDEKRRGLRLATIRLAAIRATLEMSAGDFDWRDEYEMDVSYLLAALEEAQSPKPKSLDWKRILRHVHEGLRDWTRLFVETHYLDVVTTDYPLVVLDRAGLHAVPTTPEHDRTIRFREDPVVAWIRENAKVQRPRIKGPAGLTEFEPLLNALAAAFPKRRAMPEMKAFYRRLGYSLGGFGEVFCS